MRLSNSRHQVWLAYGTNVHPSEGLGQILAFLRNTSSALKRRLCPDQTMALGLYLPASVLRELSENEYRRWELDEALQRGGFSVPTLNVFPFGDFHGERVKEKVFEPDWASPERLDYTKKAADLLQRWLPQGGFGSLSTHTGAYGKKMPGDPIWRAIAENFAKAALHLHRIEEKTGKHLMLCLEPEPFSLVETTEEFLAFYEPVLLHHAGAWLQSRWGMSASQAQELLRRHLGICFDTCHLAIVGEDLPDSLRRLLAAGIPIGKAQLSVALEMQEPGRDENRRRRLSSFDEPRYFHQTVLLDSQCSGPSPRFPDLGEALRSPHLEHARRARIHFHVPVFWDGDGPLGTTRGELESVLPALAQASEHLEIETYSWSVLPAEEQRKAAEGLEDFLEKEYRWVLSQLEERAMFVRSKGGESPPS